MKVEDQKGIHHYLIDIFKKEKEKYEESLAKKDSLEVSNTSRAFSKLNEFMNLGSPFRLDDLHDMAPGEKEEFLKMLSKLLKAGIVGYEYLEVNGKKEKHFIVNQIGDERIYGAKHYKEPFLEEQSDYNYKKNLLAKNNNQFQK